MSNKPLQIRPKGLLQGGQKPAEEVKQKRQRPMAWPGGRQLWVKLGAALCLAVLCACYIGGMGDNTAAVVARKRELPVYSVERPDKVLSVSFDASWGGDKTIAILDILDQHKVKTTFFLVGIWAEKYPELVKEIVSRGHEIGNHSASHPHMSQLSEAQIVQELDKMSDQVEELTGVRPTLFRPPYGDYNDRVVLTARREGYEAVQWSIDSLDWKDRGTEDIIKQCTYRVDNGDIVLFHNDSNDIVNALPTILSHYEGLGYSIIPISELLLKGETTIDVQGKQHPAASPKQ